ncbi:glycosyltransferase [Roseicella aquatilis]|uniref:Glycosyltransferase n=1 Tax=Roseicella aquatilis TaxID=2527868 RepID=A0A4R4DT90_9PROT|nr:glycosyltransferase [Roseicella aquatilis]TCZ66034.1 glycosyltransferase [Roseicella aquatilis]
MIGEGRSLSRVLVALPSIGLGGAEKHSAVLAEALAAAGVATTVATEPRLAEGFGAMLRPGSRLRRRGAPLGWQPRAEVEANMAAQEAALAGLLAETRPDLLLLPLPWPTHGLGLLRGAVAAGLPTLVIHHLASRDPEPDLPEAARAALAALPRAPVRFAAVSAPVAARAAAQLGLPAGAVAVVPNGVPVPPEDPAARALVRERQRRRLGLPPAARMMVFAGRLEAPKGADLLPEIAARLEAQAGATLAVLGNGSLRDRLAASRAARRDGPLRLLGHARDVPDWLLAADALLLPSRNEGCPLVFLEAAARRCPVVASGDALECFGAEAMRLAALAPSGGIADLTDQSMVMFNDPAAAGAAVDAAYRVAVALDEAAMLQRYFSLMRATLA